HGEQGNPQAFKAGCGCQMEVSGCFGFRRRRTIASGPLGPTLESLCDPFMAGRGQAYRTAVAGLPRASAISAIIFLMMACPKDLKSWASRMKRPGPPMTLSR